MKKPGTRHRARKRAVDLLFEAEAKGVSAAELVVQRREYVREDESIGVINDYTATVIDGITADSAQVDAVIESHLTDWKLSRLPAVDRAILRLATWEMFNSLDVDPMVAVDEAIQLARELSTDESPAFVNGVLGRIVELAPQVRAAQAAQPAARPAVEPHASE
ncbi:transcription antitermination factor NusB [Williamsia sterculiae]|uniref:Transcription antitermination protein NusB n=1 Tax=Williamsia sterculiae TaxID=1344003 RepID=A0A1N7EHR4_9NOCA|nr:transcription antitermination factor NusB [Williamsia sterculiae]SIR87607.1 NusB antitermination factor [Williamsia sterculiae]